jgi:NADPH:quinone reductase-like Zn-dependent oxidoreductase
MKAIVCTKYGPPEVLKLREVDKPTPKNNEVLIKIFATSVTASDCIVRGFKVPLLMKIPMALAVGFPKPRNPILGQVLAGEIEIAGKDVKRFQKGDRIIAFTYMRFGTYAEYTCLPENSAMALKPSNITYEEAAAIPYGGMLALYNLKKGNIQSGQNILIYGASGAIGTSAIQLAKYFGAKVTGVCSTANLEFVKSLGADTVLDYTKDDFTNKGELYDFILDAVGKRKSSKFKVQCKKALTSNGKYISVDDGTPKIQAEDIIQVLTLLKDLVEAGKIRPVIDRCYLLEHMVEAHQYADKGHKKGNVVITVADINEI